MHPMIPAIIRLRRFGRSANRPSRARVARGPCLRATQQTNTATRNTYAGSRAGSDQRLERRVVAAGTGLWTSPRQSTMRRHPRNGHSPQCSGTRVATLVDEATRAPRPVAAFVGARRTAAERCRRTAERDRRVRTLRRGAKGPRAVSGPLERWVAMSVSRVNGTHHVADDISCERGPRIDESSPALGARTPRATSVVSRRATRRSPGASPRLGLPSVVSRHAVWMAQLRRVTEHRRRRSLYDAR